MDINATVEVPKSCSGKLQYVQLTDMCRQIPISPDMNVLKRSKGFELDFNDPIEEKAVSAAGKVDFHTDDSPGQPVLGGSTKVNDRFRTWLLWKPHPPDAARVPLAIVEWHWTAEAKKTGEGDCEKGWKVVSADAKGGTGKSTNDLPTWTKVAQSIEPEKTKEGC